MEYILFAIPFITAIILLLFFHKNVVWWEYILLIVPPILLTLVFKCIMVEVNTMDTEYYGGYVTRVTHYDDWDETRMVPVTTVHRVGKTTVTQTHYVPKRFYYPDKYTYVSNLDDSEIEISEALYERMKNRLSGEEIFRDMHRDYRSIDGDAHDVFYDSTIVHLYDITIPHTYRNKVAASQSYNIYKLKKVTDEEVLNYGLFEYPTIDNTLSQNPILGDTLDTESVNAIKRINALYGKEYQFRIFVCIFKDKPFEVSEMQRAYWQNGNKNEIVVCLGTENDSTVAWVNAFSWSDEPNLEVMTRAYFAANPKLDLVEYADLLAKDIPTKWIRKEFEDFNYLSVEVSKGEYIVLFIIMILFEIGLSIFVVKNEIDNKEK